MSAVNYDKWNLIAESDEEDLQKNRNTLESLKTGADEIFNNSQNSDDFKRSLDMYKSVVRNINPPIEKSTIYVPCLLNICCCYTKLNEVDLCLSMIEDILQLTTLSNEERVRCHYFKVICVIKGKLDHLVWTAMNSCEHIETFLESRPDQILGSYNEFFGMKKQIQNQLEKIGTREQFIRKAKLIVEACQKYVRNGKIPPETSDALNGVEVVCRKLAKEEDMYTLLEEILHVKCDDVMRTGNLLEASASYESAASLFDTHFSRHGHPNNPNHNHTPLGASHVAYYTKSACCLQRHLETTGSDHSSEYLEKTHRLLHLALQGAHKCLLAASYPTEFASFSSNSAVVLNTQSFMSAATSISALVVARKFTLVSKEHLQFHLDVCLANFEISKVLRVKSDFCTAVSHMYKVVYVLYTLFVMCQIRLKQSKSVTKDSTTVVKILKVILKRMYFCYIFLDELLVARPAPCDDYSDVDKKGRYESGVDSLDLSRFLVREIFYLPSLGEGHVEYANTVRNVLRAYSGPANLLDTFDLNLFLGLILRQTSYSQSMPPQDTMANQKVENIVVQLSDVCDAIITYGGKAGDLQASNKSNYTLDVNVSMSTMVTSVNTTLLASLCQNDILRVNLLSIMSYVSYYFKKQSKLSAFDWNNKFLHTEEGPLVHERMMAHKMFVQMSQIQNAVVADSFSKLDKGKNGMSRKVHEFADMNVQLIENYYQAAICATAREDAVRLLEKANSARQSYERSTLFPWSDMRPHPFSNDKVGKKSEIEYFEKTADMAIFLAFTYSRSGKLNYAIEEAEFAVSVYNRLEKSNSGVNVTAPLRQCWFLLSSIYTGMGDQVKSTAALAKYKECGSIGPVDESNAIIAMTESLLPKSQTNSHSGPAVRDVSAKSERAASPPTDRPASSRHAVPPNTADLAADRMKNPAHNRGEDKDALWVRWANRMRQPWSAWYYDGLEHELILLVALLSFMWLLISMYFDSFSDCVAFGKQQMLKVLQRLGLL